MPIDFVPRANDGEVEEFYRVPLENVVSFVSRTEGDTYKDNCNLVVLDFMVRHGVLTPEIPGYLSLVQGLKSGDLS